jgi:hypothetical protein
MTLQAAMDALHHDSGLWETTSQTTRTAGQDARALTLTEHDLSWAANYTALNGVYASLQQKVFTLLGEAADVTGGLSVTLDKVAVAYESTDERAAAALKGVWDVRE